MPRYIHELPDWPAFHWDEKALAPAVGRLQCFRGIQVHSAMVLATELGDWRRFASPRHLMAYLGLVPREDSTGGRERKGSITKASERGGGGAGGAVGSGLDTAAEAAGRGALSAVEQTVEGSAVLSAPGDVLGAAQSGVGAVTIEPAGAVIRAAGSIVGGGAADPSMVAPDGSGGGGW